MRIVSPLYLLFGNAAWPVQIRAAVTREIGYSQSQSRCQLGAQPSKGSQPCRKFIISHLISSDNTGMGLGSPKVRDLRCGVASDRLNQYPLGEDSIPEAYEASPLLLELVPVNGHCNFGQFFWRPRFGDSVSTTPQGIYLSG